MLPYLFLLALVAGALWIVATMPSREARPRRRRSGPAAGESGGLEAWALDFTLPGTTFDADPSPAHDPSASHGSVHHAVDGGGHSQDAGHDSGHVAPDTSSWHGGGHDSGFGGHDGGDWGGGDFGGDSGHDH